MSVLICKYVLILANNESCWLVCVHTFADNVDTFQKNECRAASLIYSAVNFKNPKPFFRKINRLNILKNFRCWVFATKTLFWLFNWSFLSIRNLVLVALTELLFMRSKSELIDWQVTWPSVCCIIAFDKLAIFDLYGTKSRDRNTCSSHSSISSSVAVYLQIGTGAGLLEPTTIR